MQNVTLTFTVQEVNTILTALGNAPYASVFELVEKIRKDASSQLNANEITEVKEAA